MPRIHSDPTPSSVTLAGTLRTAIPGHAAERFRHFFVYLYLYKMITDRLNAAPYNAGLNTNGGVSSIATHQVDSGVRSTDISYEGFLNKDANVIDLPATAFRRMDAAHYCNLGVTPTFSGIVAQAVQHANDEVLLSLFEGLKQFCGNTRLMPQRINIGPDRVIDRLHGRLAMQMLDGTPPIDEDNARIYLAAAVADLQDYRRKQLGYGNDGVVACIDLYLAFYADVDHVGMMWRTVKGNAWADCGAYGIPVGSMLA